MLFLRCLLHSLRILDVYHQIIPDGPDGVLQVNRLRLSVVILDPGGLVGKIHPRILDARR